MGTAGLAVVAGKRPVTAQTAFAAGSISKTFTAALILALAEEGRLGFWRWLSLFLGVAGTYRKNDTVDVVYTQDGRRSVVSLQAL